MLTDRTTTAHVTARPKARRDRRHREVGPWTVALAGGTVVGVASWAAHEYLPAGADLLGNSAALWLAVSWAAGSRSRRPAHGALVGAVALLVTVTAFYAALHAVAGRGDFASTVGFWYVASLAGGPVFGLFGWLRATGRPVWRGLSAAAIGAAFLAEAAVYARQPAGLHTALTVEVVVGLVTPFALARSRRDAAATLGWLPVVLAAGAAGWVAVLMLYPRLAG